MPESGINNLRAENGPEFNRIPVLLKSPKRCRGGGAPAFCEVVVQFAVHKAIQALGPRGKLHGISSGHSARDRRTGSVRMKARLRTAAWQCTSSNASSSPAR
jgi:hypothetical protein